MRKHRGILAGLIAFSLVVLVAGIVSATVTASDSLNGKFKCITYTWSGETINIPFTSTNAAAAGGVKIGTFPAGVIAIHGAVLKSHVVTVTATNGVTASSQGDVGIGSAVGSGTDISTTEVNIIPKTTQNTMTNPASAYLAAPLPIDGTSTAVPVYVNLLMDMLGPTGAIHTNAVTSAGKLQIIYSELLDY